MLYMGVDLGGTGIKAGVVSENGEILSKGSTPTMKERPYQDIIRDIAALCEKVAGQANVTMDEIAAIGVGQALAIGGGRRWAAIRGDWPAVWQSVPVRVTVKADVGRTFDLRDGIDTSGGGT